MLWNVRPAGGARFGASPFGAGWLERKEKCFLEAGFMLELSLSSKPNITWVYH